MSISSFAVSDCHHERGFGTGPAKPTSSITRHLLANYCNCRPPAGIAYRHAAVLVRLSGWSEWRGPRCQSARRSVRSECLDHLIVFNEANLRRVLSAYVAITIASDRTARWARQFHAARRGPPLGKHAERSSRNLCLAGYTAFTVLLHDKFLRPTRLHHRYVRV